MWLYGSTAVVALIAFPFALRRSGGSMTRYCVGTGAPLVLLLLGAAALVSTVIAAIADATLAREAFTGALIGGAFAQFILLRRGPTADGTGSEEIGR